MCVDLLLAPPTYISMIVIHVCDCRESAGKASLPVVVAVVIILIPPTLLTPPALFIPAFTLSLFTPLTPAYGLPSTVLPRIKSEVV